jgi:hypothetical protein
VQPDELAARRRRRQERAAAAISHRQAEAAVLAAALQRPTARADLLTLAALAGAPPFITPELAAAVAALVTLERRQPGAAEPPALAAELVASHGMSRQAAAQLLGEILTTPAELVDPAEQALAREAGRGAGA